jgi:hypothetical protein
LLLSFLTLFLLSAPAWGGSPANGGYTGLWEYPTAEVLEDGKGWFGYTDANPYITYYLALGYLPKFELNFRITEVTNVPLDRVKYPRFGSYKDHAFDAKYQILPQEGLRPAIAVGILDLSTTEHFRSEYIAGTLTIDDWAFTVGWGSDRLGGLFGGISWQPCDWLELKGEYGSMDYSYDIVNGEHPIKLADVESDYNYGAVIKTSWADIAISYQRGDELSITAFLPFDLRDLPIFDNKKRPMEDVSIDALPSWSETNPSNLVSTLTEVIPERLGVRNVKVKANLEKRELLISYENIGYSSEAEAMARVLYLVSHFIPWDTEAVTLEAQVRGAPIVRVAIPGEHCALLRLNELRKEYSQEATACWADTMLEEEENHQWTLQEGPSEEKRGEHTYKAYVAYEPRILRSDYEDYDARWSIDVAYEWDSTEGKAGVFDVRIPIHRHGKEEDFAYEPWTNEKTRIWQAVYSNMERIDTNTFQLYEVGWLDAQWFGTNYWKRTYFNNGRYFTGIRLGLVHERDPEGFANLADESVCLYHDGCGSRDLDNEGWMGAGWLQVGYHEPRYDLDLMAEAGAFVDSDSGVKLSAMRHWDDIGIGFYVTRAGTLRAGEEYSFVGVELEIPTNIFFGSDTNYTWNREIIMTGGWPYYTGRQPWHWQDPDLLWGQLNPDRILNNLYEELEQGQKLVKELE